MKLFEAFTSSHKSLILNIIFLFFMIRAILLHEENRGGVRWPGARWSVLSYRRNIIKYTYTPHSWDISTSSWTIAFVSIHVEKCVFSILPSVDPYTLNAGTASTGTTNSTWTMDLYLVCCYCLHHTVHTSPHAAICQFSFPLMEWAKAFREFLYVNI